MVRAILDGFNCLRLRLSFSLMALFRFCCPRLRLTFVPYWISETFWLNSE